MDLYCSEFSAPSRSVMLTAKALGLELNKKFLNLHKKEQMDPDFLAINPQHCVPTLVDEDFALWESRAICTYLVSKYGEDDSLYPSDPKTRAQIDRLLYFDMGTLYKRFGEYVYPVLFGNEKPNPDKLELIQEALGWLDGFLDGHSFCVGDDITVADFVLISTVSSILESDIECSDHANVIAWSDSCKDQMVDYETENAPGAKRFGDFVKAKMLEMEED